MEADNIIVNIDVQSKDVEKQLNKCYVLARHLQLQLEKLNKMNINIQVTDFHKAKWYQFWE